MEILYYGFGINNKTFDEVNGKSKVKASSAPTIFSNLALSALAETGANIQSEAMPSVHDYPGGALLYWKARREVLPCGVESRWFSALNLQVIKQIGFYIQSFYRARQWLMKNKNVKDKVMISCSVYPPYSTAIIKLGKKYNCKTIGVITDLPQSMYTRMSFKGLKNLLHERFANKMVELQTEFDGYILLTKQMAKKMNISHKPYIVVEGFCDPSVQKIMNVSRNDKKTIMYAGAFDERYGIRILVDGFMKVDGDYELWMYGGGECFEYVKQCADKDPRIKVFGRVPREVVLKAEQEAHLLAMLELSNDPIIEYSSPSKVFEYMLAGTPVLSTRMPGFPDEYHQFFYHVEEETADGVAKAIREVFGKSEKELIKKGKTAQKFVLEKKTCSQRSNEIDIFIRNVVKS